MLQMLSLAPYQNKGSMETQPRLVAGNRPSGRSRSGEPPPEGRLITDLPDAS